MKCERGLFRFTGVIPDTPVCLRRDKSPTAQLVWPWLGIVHYSVLVGQSLLVRVPYRLPCGSSAASWGSIICIANVHCNVLNEYGSEKGRAL